ncbi:MAG TPA: DHA2 family efflux MFS transporter permease subunit [Woeseiaceae bacterium]|nr:DHA2 family efflux MFS transporter permease subunit [Woeseiaceae bacterium]
MSSTEAFFARYGPAYRGYATVTAMVAAIAVILSSTIVNVAIPDIMGAFGIDQVRAQWLSTGFLAAMTSTMLLTDWANRAIGQRGSIMAALLLFLLGSILGGLAPGEHVLILARVVQGAAAGIIQPMAMIILFTVYPVHRRGAAMGIYGIGVVLAPALGPWIGGMLMDTFNWRYVFFLGVPFAALGIVLAALFLPQREQPEVRQPGFDWTGFLLLCVFLASLLTALSNGQRLGWDSGHILAEFAIAMAAIGIFAWWERRSSAPMLDLALFGSLPFASAMLISFIMGAGLFGSVYLLPLFVQTIQGLTPTMAGLLLMPAGFVLVLVFPVAGRLSDRLSPGLLIAAGLLVFAWSSWLTAQVDVNTGFWHLAGWTVMTRIGLGFVFPALTAGSLRVLPDRLMAQGSGAINFTRQLGGAFGVNLLAVILARRTALHAQALAATQTPDNPATMTLLGHVADMVAAAGLPEPQQLPAALLFLGRSVYLQANTLAYRDGFLITAVVFAVALLPTWVLYRAVRAQRQPC